MAPALDRFLIAIATVQRRGRGAKAEILDSVTEQLREIVAESTKDFLSDWLDRRPIIEQMLETKAVSMSAKATDLSSDFGLLYVATRINTDIRPVFEENTETTPTKILGATIIQMMTIDYISSNGMEGSISLALDTKDLKQLITICQRAFSKSTATHKLISGCIEQVLIDGINSDC